MSLVFGQAFYLTLIALENSSSDCAASRAPLRFSQKKNKCFLAKEKGPTSWFLSDSSISDAWGQKSNNQTPTPAPSGTKTASVGCGIGHVRFMCSSIRSNSLHQAAFQSDKSISSKTKTSFSVEQTTQRALPRRLRILGTFSSKAFLHPQRQKLIRKLSNKRFSFIEA